MRKIEIHHNETDCSLTFPPLTDSEIAYLEVRRYLREEKEAFVSDLRQELIQMQKKIHKIEINTRKSNHLSPIFKKFKKAKQGTDIEKQNLDSMIVKLSTYLERAEKDLVDTYLMPLDIGKNSSRV